MTVQCASCAPWEDCGLMWRTGQSWRPAGKPSHRNLLLVLLHQSAATARADQLGGRQPQAVWHANREPRQHGRAAPFQTVKHEPEPSLPVDHPGRRRHVVCIGVHPFAPGPRVGFCDALAVLQPWVVR